MDVRVYQVEKKTNVAPAIAILGVLVFLTAIFLALNALTIFAYLGAIGVLVFLVVFGTIIGVVIGRVWFDIPLRVKFLNALWPGRNYIILKRFISINRAITKVIELGTSDTITVKNKAFMVDNEQMRAEDGAPALYYDDRSSGPVNFNATGINPKLSPELFSIAIQKERELARLQASNWAKALKMILWIIVGLAALGLLVNVLNYFKLDDFAKSIGHLASQAIDSAKTTVGVK